MVDQTVPPGSASAELAGLLASPEIERLVAELDARRWTGRPGYPIRAMVGIALAKSLYALPTWTRTVARETPRFRKLYKQRGAVEREFGRLKHQWALAPLRVRQIERVRLHAD
jgi:hypothetical protein